MMPAGEGTLVQIVDAALADAARRSGHWLVCRPGCNQCCIGVFSINQLDVLRLRRGLAQLETTDPAAAARLRQRAQESVHRLREGFPGDARTGILGEDEASERLFEEFGDDEPCPALSPENGSCELYAHRPMTCRTFGPPVRSGEEGDLAVCELCYEGATEEEIAACEMRADPDNLESQLLPEAEKITGQAGNTLVAFALAG